MTALTFPNEVILQFFHVADLKFCEALALTSHQNYSIYQTFINDRFQNAILSDRVIHTIQGYDKATLIFKLKVIKSVNLATQMTSSDFDFKCLIMSKQLNWYVVTAFANTLGIEMGRSNYVIDEMEAAGKTFIEKDYAVLLSENAVSSKESSATHKSAEELCNEFSVELPTAFELFSYHVFKSAQCLAEVQRVQKRFEVEIEPVKGLPLIKCIEEHYAIEMNGLQEKYIEKSDSIWVPTSTPISGKDLRMKARFSFDEEKGTFCLSHQEKNIKVECIRARVQL